MSKPNVSITVEPVENGELVYLAAVPLSPGEAPRHRLNFRLSIKNEGDDTETLQKISVLVFRTPSSSILRSFERDITMGPGSTRTTYLFKDEGALVPDLPVVKYQIRLHFLGHDEPAVFDGQARPHVSPTSQGSYRFFGSTDDMGFHEYFVQSRHGGNNNQFFGYDVKVRRWISEKRTFGEFRPHSGPTENEDYFGYGKPLYALADGTVISAVNDIDNNPAPGKRALMRVAEAEAGLVGSIKLVRLSETRMATAVRTATGTLKIIVWERKTPGIHVAKSQLIRLGDIETEESVSSVDAFALSSKLLITAIRLVDGRLRLVAWEISNGGMTLTRLGEDDAEIISQLSAVKLTNTRLAVSIITAAGNLKVIVWDVGSDGGVSVRRGETEAGGISRLDTVALSQTRLLTVVRTESKTLKLTVWKVLPEGIPVQGNDETVPGTISDLSVADIRSLSQHDKRVATTTIATNGQLRIRYWKINTLNQIQLIAKLNDGKAQAARLSHVTEKDEDDIAVCSISSSGLFQFKIWRWDAKEKEWLSYSQSGGGPTDLIDLIWLHDSTPYYFVTAVRTAQKSLKLILWFLGSGAGNYVLILHGDEVVAMDHMMKGSINPALLQTAATVKRGQFVGRLGNSGASGSPHLHIHAEQIDESKSVDELIKDKQESNLEGVFRPMPFHNVQALRLDGFTPGPGVINNDPFVKVSGNGFYWEPMAIWPGTSTPGIPTGRSNLTFWGVSAGDFQALFDAVTGANYHPVWFDAYSRGRAPRYNILFRPNPAPAWSMKIDRTASQFERLVDKRRQEGFRLVHVNNYQIGDTVRYAGIFRKADGIDWKAYHDRPVHEHQSLLERFSGDGFAPINVSVVSIARERRYTALYEKRNVGALVLKSKLTTEAYQKEFNDQGEAGRTVAYLDAYLHNGSVRYSAIWNEEHKGSAVLGHHHQTSTQMQEKFDELSGDGFITVALAGYVANNESHFAAIWRK